MALCRFISLSLLSITTESSPSAISSTSPLAACRNVHQELGDVRSLLSHPLPVVCFPDWPPRQDEVDLILA